MGLLFIGLPGVSANLIQIRIDRDDPREETAPSWRNGAFEDFQITGGAEEIPGASVNSYASINLRGHQSIITTGAPGETVTLTLRNFLLYGHSTFTLQGTATTTFVINVTGQFSLSGSSRIVLSDGVRWDHVFFNVLGQGRPVSLRKSAILWGTLTATQRNVKPGGYAIVYGRVIANRVILRGAAQIILPPIVSP